MGRTHSLDLLDRIRVASPCPKRWDDMAGDERKRFCDDCRLNVYNLSAMSRREAVELVARAEGRLCAYFFRRADGTILTRDCPVGLAAARAKTAAAIRRIAAALVLVAVGGLMLGTSRGPLLRLRQMQPFATVCKWLDPRPQKAWAPVGPVLGGAIALPLPPVPAPPSGGTPGNGGGR